MNENIRERVLRLTKEILVELQLRCSCHVASVDIYQVPSGQIAIGCPQHGVKDGYYFLDMTYGTPQSVDTDQSLKEKIRQAILARIRTL